MDANIKILMQKMGILAGASASHQTPVPLTNSATSDTEALETTNTGLNTADIPQDKNDSADTAIIIPLTQLPERHQNDISAPTDVENVTNLTSEDFDQSMVEYEYSKKSHREPNIVSLAKKQKHRISPVFGQADRGNRDKLVIQQIDAFGKNTRTGNLPKESKTNKKFNPRSRHNYKMKYGIKYA